MAWIERVRAELNELKDQIPDLLENSEDPPQRKRLQVLDGDLETMLQELDEMPHLQPQPLLPQAPESHSLREDYVRLQVSMLRAICWQASCILLM